MSKFVALVVEDDPFQREALPISSKRRPRGVGVRQWRGRGTGPGYDWAELRALVTDVNLGGKMSGVELAQYAKGRLPGLNVVMVSGHGPPTVPHDTHFLMKPFEPQQLLDAVLR